MDKAVLKKFAIESRQDLMQKMENKIKTFYIDEEFSKQQSGDVYILANSKHSLNLSKEEYTKRELLIKRINELGLDQVIEEAAYTWFNRIVAIRYMEIHDYLPLTRDNQSLGIRVLSSKDNTPDPEIMKFTNLMNPDLDIDFRKEKFAELKDDNEKFKYILLLICKKLGRVIPQVFDGITDYIDILIPDNLLNDSGYVTKLLKDVSEENFAQVEIIGWLYQYYNQEEKDKAMAQNRAYYKNEIPYVTQLFTPNWIVKYMVENSIGRLWAEHNKDDELINEWKYLIKDNLSYNNEKISPEEISVIDPCCGSGHILVYAFEVLYKIYLKSGYSNANIPEMIIKNNLFGLDIDDRAGQLSILSVILKAREYDRNIFNKNYIKYLNIMSIQESNNIRESQIEYLKTNNNKEMAQYLIRSFKDAKELGSLLLINENDYTELENELNNNNTLFIHEIKRALLPIINEAKILSKKFDVVITNPPYLNNGSMSEKIKEYLQKNYTDSKMDLCTAFMETRLINDNGYLAMINQNSWMFLSSFEKLRYKVIKDYHMKTMLHLGTRAFEEIGGEVVQTTSFVMTRKKDSNDSIFFKLTEINNANEKEISYLKMLQDKDFYKKNQEIFLEIPSSPISYWLSEKLIDIYSNEKSLSQFAIPKCGLKTGITEKYVKHWYEVNYNDIGFNIGSREESIKSLKKWFPASDGGYYRKWYGNLDDVVWWFDDGYEIRNLYNPNGKLKSRPQNMQYYFKEGLTWSALTTKKLSLRISKTGTIISGAGYGLFNNNVSMLAIMGLLNSNVVDQLVKAVSQTLNYEVGTLEKIPIKIANKEQIENIVKNNINISKEDWDSFETSWEFKVHPLIKEKEKFHYGEIGGKEYKLSDCYNHWQDSTEMSFNKLKENEEKLNEIFIDIYGLKDELTPEVEDKDITIRKADKEREIKSLISYAVGCMFGRYSLDKEGLIYAGGDFDEIYKKCKKTDGGWAGVSLANYKVLNDNGQEIDLSFEVDNDNVIPITDEAYFSDDIVERFKIFISVVYGEKTLNENLDFIAETLGKKGTETSEDTIRRYFVNDFFNDHVKTYQKRPIYWLLDSGKKNGFKALIYMHRYNENLIPKARLDYLHRVQTTYEKLLSDINYKLTTDLSMSDKKDAQKRQADLNAKLQEIKEYDEKISHVANQRISIDLDDGVKVNYEKFKDILAKIK